MTLYEGEFYKTLIEWTESQFSEVQYNCAGIIGHIALNRKTFLCTVLLNCYVLVAVPLDLCR